MSPAATDLTLEAGAHLGLAYQSTLADRRNTGVHYTPPNAAMAIVVKTLEPVVLSLGSEPSSEQLLALRCCDPAVGSGIFLLQACRLLGGLVMAAREREGQTVSEFEARTEIAKRCLYGCDIDPRAIAVADTALWAASGFSTMCPGLVHGDFLVGLSRAQILGFHWDVSKAQPILALKDRPDSELRCIGDVLVGAFFGRERSGEREKERRRRLDLVERHLGVDAEASRELDALRAEIRTRFPVFHHELEWPKMNAVFGNPPFAGSTTIAKGYGPEYIHWLKANHPGSHGNADLSAFFLRQSTNIVGPDAACGFITTNTISQGDTRATGLKFVVENGWKIYHAHKNVPWKDLESVLAEVDQ